jgi:hypothetical protein
MRGSSTRSECPDCGHWGTFSLDEDGIPDFSTCSCQTCGTCDGLNGMHSCKGCGVIITGNECASGGGYCSGC